MVSKIEFNDVADGIPDGVAGEFVSNTSLTAEFDSLVALEAGWINEVCKYGEALRSMVRRDGSTLGSMSTEAELAETGVVFRLRDRRSRACALALALEEEGMLKRLFGRRLEA
jgi:hypothetical protein